MRLPVAFALLLPLAACAATPARFEPVVMAELGEKLGGCAPGDLVPGGPNEVAVVSVSGALRVIARAPGGWRVLDAGTASGEMIQVAVGDVWPQRGGDELVAVGMAEGDEDSGGAGAVFVSGFDDASGRFFARPVFTDMELVHAVAVVDLDSSTDGAEALVGGYSGRLHLLRFHPDGSVSNEQVGTTPGAAKGMTPHQDGVAIACDDGSLLHLRPNATGYGIETLFQAPAGLARLASKGDCLLAASDDGQLWLVEDGEAQAIHREDLKLRGAVLAELDRSAEGPEAATVGYSGLATLLRLDEAGWSPETIFTSGAGLHHLTVGELDRAKGEELVTVGYQGQVVLLRRAN